ncbi:MAG: adenosine deaminase [Bifidobacterium scardovii]|uniref:adenosine deaminase n=1 Tax=Bifidobacterium scardovii TaxID=158787 RepID=UPI0006689AC5|nr:adenosine deaminase [Bifidobacterium scardovii]MBS6946897.1 adenosine deaminase [Bifidobacterium scardovii]MDU3735606.1 adenosine deaminase [Bifidobacterium scardovii]MDU5298012.1 adenosine deaminase [Bifidobacterium scardovii]MDU5610628.1 adenosine deaminase [Bifidobacterium scardovii]MDU5887242.1 adenosine deaminase [Bifidobacterium scardovii]
MTNAATAIAADLSQALRTMPKAELHVHIEGTLEPELALALAERNHVALPWTDLEELRRQYEFENLQSFLDLYYQLMATLRTADDFRDLMLAYLERAAADGVRHAEIFFDPQVHVGNGIDLDTVIDGLLEGLRLGRERFGITGGLILCIVRDMPVASAEAMLTAARHRAGDLIGVGLDSAEVGYPPSLFAEVFAKARALGLHCVAHAGEEGPAAYVAEALDLLHAERIDHGIHAIDDEALVRRLAATGTPLTCCPLSNRRLQVVHDLHDLPLRRFLDAGVAITVNSDDPAYFGGYIAANYEAMASVGFTLDELSRLAENSIRATFLPNADKQALLDELDGWKARHLGDECPAS